LPGKNLRVLGEKTLLSLAIEQAMAVSGVSEVYVSTDSTEIAEEAEKSGAIVPFFRPAELAGDESPEWFAWQHLVDFISQSRKVPFQYLLSIPTTAPLRATEDIEKCINVALRNESLDGAICVTRSRRNPDFNMIRINPDETIRPPESTKIRGANQPFRRQDAEIFYEIVPAAYVMKTNYVRKVDSMWAGKLGAYVVPEERSIDIDSEFDFMVAEFLYKRSRGE